VAVVAFRAMAAAVVQVTAAAVEVVAMMAAEEVAEAARAPVKVAGAGKAASLAKVALLGGAASWRLWSVSRPLAGSPPAT